LPAPEIRPSFVADTATECNIPVVIKVEFLLSQSHDASAADGGNELRRATGLTGGNVDRSDRARRGRRPRSLRASFFRSRHAEERSNEIKPQRVTGPRSQHGAAHAKIDAKHAIRQKQFSRGEVQAAAKHYNQSHEYEKLPHTEP